MSALVFALFLAFASTGFAQTPFTLSLTSLVNGGTVTTKTYTPVFVPAAPAFATAPSVFTESGGLGHGTGAGAYANWVGFDVQNRYFYYSVTAASGYDLTITAINSSLRSSGTGPRAMAVETSDSLSGTWTQRAITNLTNTNDTPTNATGLSIPVPSGTTLYIRYRNTSTTSSNGATVTNTGSHRINSGSVQGTFVASGSPTAPAITSFNPTSGIVGDSVTITGTNFAANATVSFNGTASTSVTFGSATSLTATVPAGATSGPITAIVGAESATSAQSFTVINPNAPAISTNGTLSAFSATFGNASAPQSIGVSGTNLTADISAVASSGFEISTNGITFGPNATISQNAGNANSILSVRIASTATAGSLSGNLVISSPGATGISLPLGGNVTPILTPGIVVISQAFGGGGNTGAPYRNDFVELFNPGSSPVSLDGWSLQYASATGAFGSANTTAALSGSIASKGYHLIQLAAGTNAGAAALPAPDSTGNISMSGTGFKIALVNSTTTLSGANPLGNPTIIDFVGAGASANAFEGAGPAPAPDNTLAILRKLAGEQETNNNAADFETGAPNPRNSGGTIPVATITTNGTLTPFSTTNGTASAAQSFSVGGTNLTADITATAPASFEVSSIDATSGFGQTATIAQSGGIASGTIFVRLAASAEFGTPSGNITLSSSGATNRLVAVSGNVTAPLSGVPVVTAESFNGTVGVAFSANITATNGPNTFSATSALPVGLTLDSTTGAITGTPTAVGNSSVVISATNGNGTGNATISFTIAKGTPTITTPPTATPIRVGQTLSNSTLTGGVASVNGTFAFTAPSTAPTVSGNQSVTFTPTDSANWNTATTNVSVTVNPAPTINVNPTSLTGFSTKENAASANQTLTVNGTDLEGAVTLNASAGYQISTDGVSYSSSLTLSPNQSSAPVARAATVIASDNASNYGTPASNTWGNGSNAGTGFQPWLFNVVTNDGGTPPPAFYAGAFVGDPVTAQLTNFPAPAFGLYANPGGTAASATVSRAFSQPLAVGDSFSFQWATNWDSDVGNKGFNIFAGGNQVVNVNQGGFPGSITLNGQTAIDGAPGYGTQPMTWTFTRTTATNLQVTTTDRKGGSAVAFSTNITISAAPEGFSFYTSAMGQGDQRQPYFNNLRITSSVTSAGGNLTNTTVYVRLAANGTPGAANGNLTLTSANATTRTVTLSGTVIALAPPVITSRTINGTVGSNLTASINATNSPTSHTANGTLPPGITFNATTGNFSGTPTTAGNYTMPVTATNTDGTGTGNLTFAIAKGTPVITTPPTASQIFSDQTLANSVLSGGSANTPGNFTFTNPSAPLVLGNSTYSVTFTPAAPSNWNSVTLNVTVQVVLRTPPVVLSRTINGTVGSNLTASINATNSPTSHTANGTLPPGVTFNATTGVFRGTPSSIGNYTVAVTATNSDGTGAGNLIFAIAKGTPVITTPPVASLIYSGQQLSTSTLTGGTANTPGTFAFTNPSFSPPAGNATQSVTFTPSDTANWNSTTINVIVPVSQDPPGPPVVSNSTIAAAVGQNLTASISATNGPTSYNATTALPPGLILNATTGTITGEPLAAGNFATSVTATNIKGTGSGNLSFVIGKGTPEILTLPTARLYTDETLATAYVPLVGGLAEVAGVFEFVTPSQSFPNSGNTTQTVQVRFTPFDLANWNPAEFPATVAVDALPNYGALVLNANITQLFEGDEYSEARIRIRRPGPLSSNATINLSESPSGQLQGDITGDVNFLNLPSQVVIPAGSNSTVFYVRAKNDSVYTGTRNVTLSVTSRFHGTANQSVTLNIIEDDDASATGFAAWSNNAPRTPALIRDYAIGGAPMGMSGSLPLISENGTHWILSALVRTDDPKLTYRGEWTTDLGNGPWTSILLQTPSSQTGFGNLLFSIPRENGETKKFLRLRIHLQD